MTQINTFDRTVYVVQGSEIETMTYGEYLREYFADETTSPRGVEPRLFIREAFTGEDEQDACNLFELRKWWPNGSSSLCDTYESEDEAELARLEIWEMAMQDSNTDAPSFFFDEREAQECVDERFRFAVMDRHTGEIVSRHASMKDAEVAMLDEDSEYIVELATQI
jgi:hypothetical protein